MSSRATERVRKDHFAVHPYVVFYHSYHCLENHLAQILQTQVPNADAVLHITALADMGETYEDGSQYHWMEPYAINTTSGAVHPWSDEFKKHKDLQRMTLNPPHGVIESGKEGPPKGHTMKWISKSDVESDVLLHVGDLSYATGFESEWDIFMSQIEPIASSIPYMIAQGNHERDFPNSGSTFSGGDSGGECGTYSLT